jgi:hypothetical protein
MLYVLVLVLCYNCIFNACSLFLSNHMIVNQIFRHCFHYCYHNIIKHTIIVTIYTVSVLCLPLPVDKPVVQTQNLSLQLDKEALLSH